MVAPQQWPIERLKPYSRNARTHSAEEIAALAKSIDELGLGSAIVIRDGVIAKGHRTSAACAQLYAAGKSVYPVPGKSAGAKPFKAGHIPIIDATGWNDAQFRAYVLADNRHALSGGWDSDLLAFELDELRDMKFDLSTIGFAPGELNDLIGTPNTGFDPDEVPPAPVVPVSRAGDIWRMGPHRIMVGDCRDPEQVAQLLAGRTLNLAVTSPPYAEQRDYDESSGFRPIPPREYVEWFAPVAANIAAALEPDGSWFVNIKPPGVGLDTDLYVFDLVIAHVRSWGWHFATEFCWERNGVPKSVTQRFKNQFEPVYQFTRGRWKMNPEAVRHESANVPMAGGEGSGNTTWRNAQGGVGAVSVSGSFGAAKKKRKGGTTELMSDSQGHNTAPGEYIGPGLAYPGNRLPTFNSSHEALGHAAAFPVGLPEFFIKAYTDEGDAVFDPFVGSGSSLMACERTGRTGFGMELSPAYCDVSVIRWQTATGKQATLDGDGRTFEEVKRERTETATVAEQ